MYYVICRIIYLMIYIILNKTRTDDSDRHYYVCFTKVDGHLYELDGSKAFPIDHGPCEDFVQVTIMILIYYISCLVFKIYIYITYI